MDLRRLIMMTLRRTVWLCLFCLALSAPGCRAAGRGDDSLRSRYTKRDVLITMRDGIRLYTVIFAPKDTSRTYPILFNRTPYSVAYGPDDFPDPLGPSRRFDESGYIFVHQDVRGRFMSEGTFENMRPELTRAEQELTKTVAAGRKIDESTDSYDSIDWLLRNVAGCNGRVGMWGISYPGFYAACGMVSAHPALKAVSPQAPIADWFMGDDDNHNGASMLMDNFSWDLSGFDSPRTQRSQRTAPPVGQFPSEDAYAFYLDLGPLKNANDRYFHGRVPFWNDLMEHDTYDSYWQAHGLLPHLRDIKPAVLIVGGWFDAEDYWGTIHIYRTLRKSSPNTDVRIAIGPWPHGGWAGGEGDHFGDIDFGAKTAAAFREQVEFPFFERYLKGNGSKGMAHLRGNGPTPSAMPAGRRKKAAFIGAASASVGSTEDPRKENSLSEGAIVTGAGLPRARVFNTGANRWLFLPSWPPPGLKRRHLYFQAGGELTFTRPTGTAKTADTYVSDPAHPVAYSAAAETQIERKDEYMIEDQRFAAGRMDILRYQTPPLTRDVTMMGPLQASLFTSLTGTDADFIVKLIDVFPADVPPMRGKPMGNYQMLVRAEVMRGKFRSRFDRPEPFLVGQVTHVRYELPDVCHTFRKGHRIMVQVQSSWFPLIDRNPQRFMKIPQAEARDFHKETVTLYHSPRFPSSLDIGIP